MCDNITHKISMAKTVLEETGYHILPNRTIDPTQYSYPSHSIESKKAVLLSLGPMLTKADGDRKQEVQACENFTRCKVMKVKGNREMAFSYTDLDSDCGVSHEEYEMRYMLYLESRQSEKSCVGANGGGLASIKKATKAKSPFHDASSAKVSRHVTPLPVLETVAAPHSPANPPSNPVFGEFTTSGGLPGKASSSTSSVPFISAIDENNMLAIMNIPGSPVSTRSLSRSGHTNKRRQTLSPQSSKDMLREVCDDLVGDNTAIETGNCTNIADSVAAEVAIENVLDVTETDSESNSSPPETASSSEVNVPSLFQDASDIVILENNGSMSVGSQVHAPSLPDTPVDDCDFDDSEMLEIDTFSSRSRKNVRKRKPANDHALNSSRRKSLDVEDLQSMFDDEEEDEVEAKSSSGSSNASAKPEVDVKIETENASSGKSEDKEKVKIKAEADLWDECQILSVEVERNISTPLCSPLQQEAFCSPSPLSMNIQEMSPSPSILQSQFNGCGDGMINPRASPCCFFPNSTNTRPSALALARASPVKIVGVSGFSPAFRSHPAKLLSSGGISRSVLHRSPVDCVAPSFVLSPMVATSTLALPAARVDAAQMNGISLAAVTPDSPVDSAAATSPDAISAASPSHAEEEEIVEDAAEDAYHRYVVRMEICKNKYLWEMVSIAAAKAARKKFGVKL